MQFWNVSQVTTFPLQLDREPSPRRSHKLPALVRDHDLDTAKRSRDSGTEEAEETQENNLPAQQHCFGSKNVHFYLLH